jgi:predicted dehydrogenase
MKAAIVGLGRMGLRHLQILKDLELEVVGAFDVQDAVREKARTDFGLTPATLFTDARAMFERAKPELAVIATTAPSHPELVCLAAQNGVKAILCEKPMATSLADCDRMIDVCAKAGTRLAINHQMRFMEQYTAAKAIVQDESFGGLSSVTVTAGNFGIAMNGSHYFEMFRYMTDEMPVTVSAWFSPETVPNPRGPQFEDRAGAVRVTTAKGRRFYMDASIDQGHGMYVTYAGPFGRLDVDELAGRAHLVVRKPEHRAQPTTRYGMPWDERSITIASADAVAPTRAVLSALLAGKNYPDGADGRMAVEVLAAAYASNEQGGRTIELANANLPRDRSFPWA